MTRMSPAACWSRAPLPMLFIGILVTPIFGAAHASAEPITFDEALALGAHTPHVEEAEDRLAARQEGDQKIRGTAQATNFTFMPGALVWPREIAGFDMQATITQGWNLRDLGDASREAASLERNELAAVVRARALRARLGAARRWIDLATLTNVAASVDARIEAIEELVARRERALVEEVGTQQPLTEARARLAELRRRRLDLEGEQFAVATQLSVAVGRPPQPNRLEPAGAMPEPPLPSEPDMRARINEIDAVPEVAVERLRESAARARAVEASARHAPVLTLGAQGERGAIGTWVVYGVTGLTYRGPGQERRLVSAADAQAAGAEVKTVGARLRARAELEEALHELKHTAALLELLEQDTLPALGRLVESCARAVSLGEESYFALFEARDRQLAAVEAAHRARGAHAWARVHLWLLLAELSREGPGS
jgi:outer membrane protein TolC